MPLVYQQNINESTRLGLWHIAEKEDFFLNQVPLKKEITHPHKRLQHLAGRFLLRELFTDFPLELIQIADTRKPYLADEAYHFSISHCDDYAAAIVSNVNRVGVDVERVSEKVQKISHKFLTEKEKTMIELTATESGLTILQSIGFAWSIKETLFKWYSLGGVDFRENLLIDQLQFSTNECTAHCRVAFDQVASLKVHGLIFNDNILTWTVS